MVEFLQGFWEAVKSGDVQAVLAVCFAFLAATSPLWIKLINVAVTKWRYRYDATKKVAKDNFKQATDIANDSRKLMAAIGKFIEDSNDSFNNLAGLLTYIIDNSTLTDAQKAYAKDTYIKKIEKAEPLPLEEIKEEPKEEAKEEVKEEVKEESEPVGL